MRSKSYFHLGSPEPLLGVTIDTFLKQRSNRFSDCEALVSIPQSRRYTYRDLELAVGRMARGLIALGIERGDRVGIWSTNNVEWVILQWATCRVGAILVNINPAYRSKELEHVLRKARLNALFLIPSFRTSDYVKTIQELCPELFSSHPGALGTSAFPELRHVVVYDPNNAECTHRPSSGFWTWTEIMKKGDDLDDADVQQRQERLDPDDPVNIQFTSGTTGSPKAVLLTHHNILNNALFAGKMMGFTQQDRLCVPVPFYHCFGMVVSNLSCLSHGATIVIPSPHFDARETLKAIEQEKCTAVHGVPTMFVAELEVPDFDDYDLSSLRTGIMAGAPCPPEVVKSVMERMGCRELLIGYGMTEASPVTHSTRREDSFERRTNTVGLNLPHQEVKVIDPSTGRITNIGESGELCFRGYHVMAEYFEDPESTSSTIDRTGWLHSGDLGRMDADGYVQITGRLKDMIIRGGENIYPAEIENVFFTHPDVMQVAVFGVSNAKLGEEVGAWIQLHEGRVLGSEQLREFARQHMAHYKVPKYVQVVDEFPMTTTGKIQKFRIREIVEERLAEDAIGPR